MAKLTYAEKLKDPRWQKKRLKILDRDGFKCVQCGDDKSHLQVHHEKYIYAEPWDYEDDNLKTLCENCHKTAHHKIDMVEEGILSVEEFVKKHPEVTKLFTKISNHEGVWDLTIFDKAYFYYPAEKYSDYQIKIFNALYNLKDYVQEVDQHIYLVSHPFGKSWYSDPPRIFYMDSGEVINFYDELEELINYTKPQTL